jgi:SPP1 family predicted phage head-tail adaptor
MGKALISPSTIQHLQVKVDEAAMPDTCSLLSTVEAADGKGGIVKTVTRTDNVPCRFTSMSGNEQVAYQVAQRGAYRIHIPLRYTVSAASHILYKGRVYDVVWTPPLTGYSTSRLIGLNEANQAGS